MGSQKVEPYLTAAHQVIPLECKSCVHVHLQQRPAVVCCCQLLLVVKQLLMFHWHTQLLSHCRLQVTNSLVIPDPAGAKTCVNWRPGAEGGCLVCEATATGFYSR